MTTDPPSELLAKYQAGDATAAEELYQRYVSRLIALARTRLSTKLARRIDPEDVVQSAYRSFFVAAAAGKFKLHRGDELWSLLAAITLNKLHRQVEFHTAAKRDFSSERHVTGGSGYLRLRDIATRDPSPLEAAAIVDELQQVMQGLDETQRRMLEYRLQGHTFEEIAQQTNRSQRTVRRLLKKLKDEFEHCAEESTCF